MNLKGGIGKTTLSANKSRALSDLQPSLKILLVDTDPQSSLTLIFKDEQEVDEIPEENTFYEILCNPTNYMSQKIQQCAKPVSTKGRTPIHLIPSHIQLIAPMIQIMISGVNSQPSLRFE